MFTPDPDRTLTFGWPPHRNRPTRPRAKTARRMGMQSAMDWPCTSKAVILGHAFVHPTKGRVKGTVGKKHLLPAPAPKREPDEVVRMKANVQRMTNWQRTQYTRVIAALRKVGKVASPEQALEMTEVVLRSSREGFREDVLADA